MTLTLGPSSVLAEYQLSSCDVVDVTAHRVPELNRQVTVDIEGRIAFPLLGQIGVVGETLDHVGETIRDGLARSQSLEGAQVTVGLTSTRAVIAGGDVAGLSAFLYQAGLSVQRAIALAGRLGLARTQGAEEFASLQGDHDAPASDLLSQQLRLALVRAELVGRNDFTLDAHASGMPEAASDPAASRRAEIVGLEKRRLLANLIKAEQKHLAQRLQLLTSRVDALNRQAENQNLLIDQQVEEVDRYQQIREQGLSPQDRLADQQRVLATLQERVSNTATEILQVQQQRHDTDV
jgi:polysaccharide export outer membrane protein